ncbi:MAG: STAS/SEC14 domain-containing protein [Myxococcales bacterium]|nr:STAS/SEC14 domain-containing protein [Myxococcales bacterium]
MGHFSSRPFRLEGGRCAIELVLEGTIEGEDSRKLVAQLRQQVARVPTESGCCLLVDQREVETATAEARRILADEAGQPIYPRIALFGGTVFTRTLARFILRASGQPDKARFFASRSEAQAWLVT